MPLDANYLVPNAAFIVGVVVLLLLVTAVIGAIVWLMSRRTRG